MRELHVVAVSEDGRHVLLGASDKATKATHRLAIDARLAAALRGELSQRAVRARRPPQRGAVPPAASTLTVREMQRRLRAGESPEQIAASADLPVERVARFAGPVLSEREKIIELAKATRLTHSRKGQSLLPLGEVVDLHLAQMAAMRADSVRWTTRREDTGTWLVEVSYVARARARSGSWRFDPSAKTLVAADTVSAGLGHSDTLDGTPAVGRPRARQRAVGAVVAAGGKRAAKPGDAKGAAPRGAAAKVSATAGEAPKAAQRGGGPSGSSATRRAAPAAGAAGTIAAPGAGPGAAGSPRAPAGPPALRVVPALDQQPRTLPEEGSEPTPATEASTPKRADGPRGRATVPAWADVLLSTSPPPPRPSDEAAD